MYCVYVKHKGYVKRLGVDGPHYGTKEEALAWDEATARRLATHLHGRIEAVIP